MLIIQTVFLINFNVYSWKKRASVASNNDNVYKFINTAKKTSCIRFFCEFWILDFILFKKAGAHGAWAPEKS